MLHLIPQVKNLKLTGGSLQNKALSYHKESLDARLALAIKALPFSVDGTPVEISITQQGGEKYTLIITETNIRITANGEAGAFYAIQTLKQIWEHDTIPCLEICDEPDFAYRGFYHDVTRGKVPTLEALKELIDRMAYYKLNSLQLYVEHTYEFEECKEFAKAYGCLTKEELQELDVYCKERFIDFIPSLATFGHMYEILRQEKYRHLRVLDDFNETPYFWRERMGHHTIDPLQEESFELVKSLINQYTPNFSSEAFNICCDETFDLKSHKKADADVGKLYIDFVNKIIDLLKSKGKKIMMWADILLQHPETIETLPEDTYFLNWDYSSNPSEENVKRLSVFNRPQIVCPGTSTWSRFSENAPVAEQNIGKLAEYGKKYGAIGVLNTNWGDYGNPCNLALSMFGMIWGAEKSWSVATPAGEDFYKNINFLHYKDDNAVAYLFKLSALHSCISWIHFCNAYHNARYQTDVATTYIQKEEVVKIQALYTQFKNELSSLTWEKDEYRKEMLMVAEGVCVTTELFAKLSNVEAERLTNTQEWLKKHREFWLANNKESELCHLEEMFRYCEAL